MYDVDKLKEELQQLEADIAQINEVKDERIKKRDECLKLIAGCEAILELHGENHGG